ncbi:hypothetical protein [Pseudidiomarina marina]|uniref:Uncharacterized protein n=1 Tax=Pseudidiomarina marina TaxID=502366 RepID=A0A432YCU9_9GAMM|nr:hypothetical protein [Pseudidiomarina marina]RUO58672.1 hypothetical protein CWI76_11145 [Pseudidiomarina marina]
MIHKVKVSNNCKKELQKLDKALSDCLWRNFIQPIQNGLVPPEELQGKYKPSWAANFLGSPMAEAFRKCAEENNLYHYHIGYRFYRTGNDPDYPGDVSEGIAHTRCERYQDTFQHTVIKLCSTHSSPFTIPLANIKDE